MASVRYLGRADVRVITAAQWAAAGVAGRATTSWDPTNGYSIPKTDFIQAQITILDLDDEFDITAPDGPRQPPTSPYDKIVTESRLSEALEGVVLEGGGSVIDEIGDVPGLVAALAAKADAAATTTALAGKQAAGQYTTAAQVGTQLWVGTQAQYDAVTPKVATTVYVIKAA